MKLSHLPMRLATGAFVLNSGLSKRNADEATAAGLHGFASAAYPQVADMQPKSFVQALSTGEIALGAALLTPFVSSRLAGAGLTAFAGGLMGLYWKAPGMHEEGDPRPTQQGLSVAKDVWMLAIGLALLLDGLSPFESTK